MSINQPSPFDNISKGIKNSLKAENLKVWNNETSKIVDVGKEGSIKDLFFSQECSNNDLNSAIESVNNFFESSTQNLATGGAKKVKNIAKKIAKRGKKVKRKSPVKKRKSPVKKRKSPAKKRSNKK